MVGLQGEASASKILLSPSPPPSHSGLDTHHKAYDPADEKLQYHPPQDLAVSGIEDRTDRVHVLLKFDVLKFL